MNESDLQYLKTIHWVYSGRDNVSGKVRQEAIEGMTFGEKLDYVTAYPRERPFIQFWPDKDGNFDIALFYVEAGKALEAGHNPMVKNGAGVCLLSELIGSRVKQMRSIDMPENFLGLLDLLEKTINSLVIE